MLSLVVQNSERVCQMTWIRSKDCFGMHSQWRCSSRFGRWRPYFRFLTVRMRKKKSAREWEGVKVSNPYMCVCLAYLYHGEGEEEGLAELVSVITLAFAQAQESMERSIYDVCGNSHRIFVCNFRTQQEASCIWTSFLTITVSCQMYVEKQYLQLDFLAMFIQWAFDVHGNCQANLWNASIKKIQLHFVCSQVTRLSFWTWSVNKAESGVWLSIRCVHKRPQIRTREAKRWDW